MIDYTYFFQAGRLQMFGICTTILTGFDLVYSDIPKVTKVTSLKYFLRNDCCYDFCIQGRWWAFSNTSIIKMSYPAIHCSFERTSCLVRRFTKDPNAWVQLCFTSFNWGINAFSFIIWLGVIRLFLRRSIKKRK